MKLFLKRLLVPVLAVGALVSTAAANLAYSNGDLLLGVRSVADPGSTQDLVINLGPASQFTQASDPFVVPNLGNVATDLGIFSELGGAAWHSRAEVSWGIVGTDLAADPANTLYATRARTSVNTQSTPWQRRSFSSQSATNSTIRAFISGYTLSEANAASPRGTIQSTSATNSYASFTSAGTDFGFFSNIEGTFANGTAGSVLDLYRLAPTTQNPAGEGLLFVGTFQFNNEGQLTFSPAAPTEPRFRLSSATYSGSEADGNINVRVQRSGVISGADTVQLDTSDGTAIAGTDYTARTAFSVNFAANETEVEVPIAVSNIAGLQPSRTFNVTLSAPSAGTLIAPTSAVVTITDSTPQNFGSLAFSASTYSFAPVNGQGAPSLLTIPITRTNGSDGTVAVDVSVASGGTLASGTDFAAIGAPATVQFLAGETSKNLTIQLNAIDASRLPGSINLALTNPQGGAALGATTTATVNVSAKDVVKPSFKLTSKPGKVSNGSYEVAGSASDNVGVGRVEVVVNGGAPQLATLSAPVGGKVPFSLAGIALENGKNTLVVTAYDASGNAAKSTTVKLIYLNSRPAIVGAYQGLVLSTGAPTNSNTGSVQLTVGKFGTFTGKVALGASSVPIKGIFDNAGIAHFNVTGDTSAAPTFVELSAKSGGATVVFGKLELATATDKVTGTVKDSGNAVVAELDSDRKFFDGKTPATTIPAAYLATKGNFTVLFSARASQAGLSATDYPQGDGFATLKLTSKGVATLKGVLADGTPVTASAPVSKDLRWPFFAKLYKKQGLIAGVAVFDDTEADSDVAAENVIWIRPASTAKHYPGGWADGILTDLFCAKYSSTAGTSVVPGLGAENLTTGNADLIFTAGALNATVSKSVNISPTNKVTNAPADKSFKLSIAAATGLISGKFPHSDNTSPKFRGAVYQKGAATGGFGHFLSTVPKGGPSGQSGSVVLDAR